MTILPVFEIYIFRIELLENAHFHSPLALFIQFIRHLDGMDLFVIAIRHVDVLSMLTTILAVPMIQLRPLGRKKCGSPQRQEFLLLTHSKERRRLAPKVSKNIRVSNDQDSLEVVLRLHLPSRALLSELRGVSTRVQL